MVLIKLFRERYGLLPAGDGAMGKLVDELVADSIQMWESGAKFAETIEYMHEYAQTWIGWQQLEILTAGRGEFLIGDIPA